jgi:hypothetical protein
MAMVQRDRKTFLPNFRETIATKRASLNRPYLDLVEGVHDEHVDQVLASSVQPVVEGLQTKSKIFLSSVLGKIEFRTKFG